MAWVLEGAAGHHLRHRLEAGSAGPLVLWDYVRLCGGINSVSNESIWSEDIALSFDVEDESW